MCRCCDGCGAAFPVAARTIEAAAAECVFAAAAGAGAAAAMNSGGAAEAAHEAAVALEQTRLSALIAP